MEGGTEGTRDGGRECFDNGHIKAALSPEKGDDEAETLRFMPKISRN